MDATSFEERAAECMRLAEETSDDLLREKLFKLGRSYLEIAEIVKASTATDTAEM